RGFEYQRASVFHGVEEDRGDFGTDTHTTAALVRYARDVITEEPEYGVGGRLTGRTGTHNVTYESNREAFGFDRFNLLHRAGHAVLFGRQTIAGHFVCSAGVQRNVRAGPGIRRRRQVIGVGFAGDLEYGHFDGFGNLVALGEPLSVGPGFHHRFGVRVAGSGFVFYVVEVVEHQQRVLQLFGRQGGQVGVVQQLNQRGDVVATLHHAQQLYRFLLADQGRRGFAFNDGGEEAGFNISCFIHTRRNTVFQQVNQSGFFASRWVFQQIDQSGSLFCVQRLGRNTQSSTFGNMSTVSF